jgi:hypothetical protein
MLSHRLPLICLLLPLAFACSKTPDAPANAVVQAQATTESIRGEMTQALNDIPSADQTGAAYLRIAATNGAVTSNGSLLNGLDFSSMNIEDAAMLMMMLISNDARSDMEQMLNEMQQDTDAKRRLRDAAARLEQALADLRAQLGAEYDRRVKANPDVPPLGTEQLVETSTILAGASDDGGLSGSVYSPGQVPDNGPGSGATFNVSLLCNTALGDITVELFDLRTATLLATKTSKNSVSLDYVAPAPVPVWVNVRISGVLPNLPETCTRTIKYQRRIQKAPVSLPPATAQTLASQRDQAVKDLGTSFSNIDNLAQTGAPAAYLEEISRQMRAQSNQLSLEDFSQMTDELRNRLEGVSEMSDDETAQMQQFMDQKTQLEQMLSNAMKAASDSQAGIVKSLKDS